jgi:amidase
VTDPRVAARAGAAADVLATAGYDVVSTVPPRFEEVVATWLAFIAADIRVLEPAIGPLMSADGNRFLGFFLDATPVVDLTGYVDLMMTRQSLIRDWQQWFTSVDLVLTPTWTQLPFAHGWDAASRENARATAELMRCVTIANLLGLPSACVPAGLVDGLPVGVIVTGDRFADDKTLDAAELIEAALGLATPIDSVRG